jgi:hypothetical protein
LRRPVLRRWDEAHVRQRAVAVRLLGMAGSGRLEKFVRDPVNEGAVLAVVLA